MKYLILSFLFVSQAFAVETGKPAPEFSLAGASGKTHKLSDFKGKTVVLEWLNHGCPFVRKHYDSNNMQTLQATYTGKGVVWLSVVSSAKGKQGYVDAKAALSEKTANKSSATEILLDPTGTVGKAYEAKTTPHMYVIDPKGVLVYQGAIDDKASTDQEDIKGATNYVAAALDATLAGKAVAMGQTKAYGCGVKY